MEDGKAFSLHDNKQLRLNLAKPYKTLTTYENIEASTPFVVKRGLKKDPKLRKQSLRRALEEHLIPSDLLGKTVGHKAFQKRIKGQGYHWKRIKKNEDIWLLDIAEKGNRKE